mgnify:CR=1 FL=1|jgi:hypothetical protein
MNFSEALKEWKLFFEFDGFYDHEYHEKKDYFFKTLNYINMLMLKGMTSKEKIALVDARRLCFNKMQVDVPKHDIRRYFITLQKYKSSDSKYRCMQQLHYFIILLKFEKAIWSKTWEFIDFDLNRLIERNERWTEPKPNYSIKKTAQISSYADSLLYLLRSREHLVLNKIEKIGALNNQQDSIDMEIKRCNHIIENIHKESFCANHYHYIRSLRSKKMLQKRLDTLSL